MSLVKATSGIIEKYPYSIGQFRRDNPNVSFPKRIPDQMLAEYGVFPVSVGEIPSFDARTEKLEKEPQPVLVDNMWIEQWVTKNKTPEEVASDDAALAAAVRDQRDTLLSESDWTQVDDAPVDASVWRTYRQALRDITQNPAFPYLQPSDWPTKP